MSCLIRCGSNVECVKQSKWMPIIVRRSFHRSYMLIGKATKGRTKKSDTCPGISPAKIKDEDASGTAEVKPCDMYSSVNVEETGDRILKETHTAEETARKPAYPKISDFLIRNIMSFPIHGPPDKSERDYDTEDSKITSFPSVTTILNETMASESRKWLEKWKQNMIAQMGTEKFFEMQKATLNRGSKLHGAIRRYLLGKSVNNAELDGNVEGCWNSVMTALPYISDIKLVETCVYHPHLHYKGIVDCVACFNNVPHVIEWKQSEKAKKNLSETYDAPIQLCAYMGTLPWCKTVDFAQPVTNGLVVVAYVDGSPADIFPMNSEYCQRYWEQWLRRVQQFWCIHSPELRENLC